MCVCIQSGFDQLQSLVINPNVFPSGKVSKATILEKSKFAVCLSFLLCCCCVTGEVYLASLSKYSIGVNVVLWFLDLYQSTLFISFE